jgi:hypothetical protein
VRGKNSAKLGKSRVQAALERAGGNAKDFGGFGVREAVVIAEDQEKARFAGKGIDGTAEGPQAFVVLERPGRGWCVCGGGEDRCGTGGGAKVESAIDDDAVEPGLDTGAALKAGGGGDDAQPGILDGVAGEVFAPAQHASGDTQQRTLVTAREMTQGAVAPADEVAKQVFVRERRVVHGGPP